MELSVNSNWIEQFGNSYIVEAIARSEDGNHATIYATGINADEADAKQLHPKSLRHEVIRNSRRTSADGMMTATSVTHTQKGE